MQVQAFIMQDQWLSKLTSALKNYVSPSLRFQIRQTPPQLKHFFSSLNWLKWQHYSFLLNETNLTTVHYNGCPENRPVLMALLGADSAISCPAIPNDDEVYVTDHAMRHAICIPFCLITIVKLGRPIEDIVATYSNRLIRYIKSQRANYRYQVIDSFEKIDAIENNMLKPYASARHGAGAAQLGPGVVQKIAQKAYGRLDLLLQGDEEVGCHLGNSYTRKGKRYWHVNRLAYPSNVFLDTKRWGEVNSINLHLALESAIENGYDYCDYGGSLARPGDGLIDWKRRRRGFLATHGNFEYFYMKLPKTGGAKFLWDSPVFGVERGKPTLHLGIPEGKTEEEMLARYHEMGYGGLYKVYLDCVTPPSAQFVESIRALYADQDPQPLIISYVVG